jgi:hypothetical protein
MRAVFGLKRQPFASSYRRRNQVATFVQLDGWPRAGSGRRAMAGPHRPAVAAGRSSLTPRYLGRLKGAED